MSPRSLLGLAAAALLLQACGPKAEEAPPADNSVTGNGVSLTSVAETLPTDDVALPPGPHRDAVEANCTACHSPAMIVSQPPLTREQWQAEVEKMQKTYHAPVDPAAVPAIVDYLASLTPPKQEPRRQ